MQCDYYDHGQRCKSRATHWLTDGHLRLLPAGALCRYHAQVEVNDSTENDAIPMAAAQAFLKAHPGLRANRPTTN